tara:strand:+ start:42 stop:1205 length:1164 start_codon:yes stop_codon:yes gene_type:complete
MANLSIPEITKSGKEYRTSLLVEKTFQRNGNMNNFMTDLGLFHASSISINRKEYKKFTSSLEGEILNLAGSRGSSLELRGKLAGKKQIVSIPINKIEKGTEFGGQPAGGKKENKGITFEKELYQRFRECIQGKCCKGKYDRQAKHILEATSAAMGSPVKDVKPIGGLNQSRPLVLSGGVPIIDPSSPEDHGKLLTDIDLIHKNGKKSHLSLKFSSTLTFVNSGVAKNFFPEAEIKSGSITNELGKKVLESLGIENELFCKVFNDYGKGGKMVDPHEVDVSKKVNKQNLKKLLQTAVGANYWMVHGMEGNKVYFWEMPKIKNDAFATISGQITLYYGGTGGTGKRIDITFSNPYFEFKLNIRNKQSGLYPSHLMMDYKSLSATGKQLL